MTTRESVHQLVDELPDEALPDVERYLTALRAERASDSAGAPSAAAEGDEPLTPEEEATIAESWAAYARGDYITHDELRARLARPRVTSDGLDATDHRLAEPRAPTT